MKPYLPLLLSFLAGSVAATPVNPALRVASRESERLIQPAGGRPVEFRYAAFPSLLQIGPDEIWIAYKVGRSHATDAGAAIEVVRHELSTGATTLLQRLVAPAPKLYQMGELVRFPNGDTALYIDVQAVGWDGRHYRAGAEVFRWSRDRRAFDGPVSLGVVDGVLYGYPFEFISERSTTWQLIMAFGYHLPGGRWSVDALRSEDSGRSWRFVRNLTEEFGGIRGNESGFVRYGDGFIVSTRGYDSIQRLHRTDGAFKVRHQTQLTGAYPFVNSHVGRPRLFIRDGQGYLLGRNITRRVAPGEKGVSKTPMQLCLIRFDPETLAANACVVLDNAESKNVTDGYYAVAAFTGEGADTRVHVITYKALGGQPPDIMRFDYRWSELK